MRLNLKQKSGVFVACVATVLLGAYFIFSVEYTDQRTLAFYNERRVRIGNMAKDVDSFLDRAQKKLRNIAASPLLVNGLEALENDKEGDEISASEPLHYFFWDSDIFTRVYLVNIKGQILWCEPPGSAPLGESFPEYEEILAKLSAQQEHSSLVTLSGADTRDPRILVSEPLIGSQDDVIGAFLGVIPPNHEAIMAVIEGFGDDDTRNIQLVDPAGIVVAGTDKSRALHPLPYGESLKALAPAEPAVLEPRYFEDSVVTAARLRNNPQWTITVDQNRKQALGDTANLQRVLTEFGLLLILIAIAALFFVVRSFTRPVELLTEDARRITAGDLSVQFTMAERTDEIGDLATALDEMKSKVKTSYERLLISEKMALMGQIISGIAHELNNPLTIVMGHTQLLLQQQTDEKVKGSLSRIQEGAARASKIVRNLLTFARQQKPERKTTDINSIILKTIELRAYELRVSNIELVTALSPIPQTMTDPHQLQQIFLNLIVNAEHAMLEANGRGRLTIKSHVVDGRIEVTFEDNGPGISEENLRRIFDPFFTTKPVGKGTGLGLSICQGIIAEHGGRLTVASTPGLGACFTVDLPIVSGAAPAAVVVKDTPMIRHKNVLVVDDEGHLREMFRQILQVDGHKIQTATNGREAIDLVHREKFDMVITDVKMPETDGAEFYRQLKTEGLDLADRLLFVTGDLMNPDTLNFLESTGNPWIAKPFEVSTAREAINKVLSSVPA